jgi:predicted 2-oxoglutarate/Fe(II)-dependent dioxygenase YbiX
MKKELFIGTVTFVLIFALIYASVANAQNATTKASNAMGNASAKANQTAGNASAKANQTASELGKNASQVGGQILNKTEDVGKKIAGGLGSLLGNASEKLKQGSK